MEYTNCDNKNIPFDVLLRALLTVDDNGDAAVRVVMNIDTEVPLITCNNNALGFEQLVRKAVVSVNGLPALNLAVITPLP